jgi:hypothetical protein
MRLVLIAVLLFVQQGGRFNSENGQVRLDQMGCTGTPSATTFLRGDCAWVTVSGGGASEWGSITGTLANQLDLNTALGTKAPTFHSHEQTDIEDLPSDINSLYTGKANLIHSHTIADTTNLQVSLDGKATTNHTHSKSNITDFNHNHDQSEITNLTTDLANKSPIPLTCNATTEKPRWTGSAWECVTDQSGGSSSPVYTVLANGTTAMALATNDVVKVTPTATATFTTTVPTAGLTKTVIILTSGTTSRTITFGTGFKPTTTLATGTTSARVFVIRFISDGTNLYEISRTVAMPA